MSGSRHKIAWKMIGGLVAFSSVITIIISAVQLWVEYTREVGIIETGFTQIERSYIDSISENVWQADSGRLDLLVSGILEFPDFEYTAIRDENGSTLVTIGASNPNSALRKVYPLSYEFRGEVLAIGELEVVASLSQVYERTIKRIGIILLSNGIKTFLVAGFMFLLVYWLITRHLERLTEFAGKMDFNSPKQALRLERGLFSGKRDEIDELGDAVNEMQERLFEAHKKIEQTVKDRTRSLSDQVKVQIKTENQLRKLSSAIDQSSIVVFITDIDGTIEYINPKFVEALGYSEEGVLGSKPSIIKSGDTPTELYADLWQTILSGNVWRGELKDRRKNGDIFWASAIISPVRNEKGIITNFVAMHEDISERKQVEDAMRTARLAAEAANKAKTDLMANMRHELRTPLNAIIGFSEIMKDSAFGPLGNDNFVEYVDYIYTSGKHLLELINDILDVSAIDSGKLELREEDVDIAEAYKVALRIISPKAEEGLVELSGLSNSNLPMIIADPLRIKQIFVNLLSNAVKFTPANGTVSCDAYLDDEGNMVITVSDTGIGMDEEGIGKAMDRFGQVDSSLTRKHEGAGLGLPLTKGLVELHGGSLKIESTPGKGTRVQAIFPAERIIAADIKKS